MLFFPLILFSIDRINRFFFHMFEFFLWFLESERWLMIVSYFSKGVINKNYIYIYKYKDVIFRFIYLFFKW